MLLLFMGRYGGPASEGFVVIGGLAHHLILIATPLLALALTFPKTTRSFGLGLLLACGVCWLVEFSICGGATAVG